MDSANRRRSGSLFLDAQHQLRQPLNALSLLIGELGAAADRRERAAIIDDMRYALQLSNAWLDALADLDKADMGLLQLRIQDVALQPVFAELQEDFAAHFEHLGLEFRVVATQAVVRADPAFLRRLVALLLDNAGKFTRRGKVLLGCRRAGARLRIEVWDSGTGVAAGEAERVFEAFYRLENEVRPRDRGLGLGLAYAKRVAALAGDQLTVASRPGHGSCFALTLRQAEPGAPRSSKRSAAAAESPGDHRLVDPLTGASVLLLAGEEAEALRGSLESWGAKTTLTSAEGLAAALRAAPDLLIADLTAFEAGGSRDLLERAAAAPPVILIRERRPGGSSGEPPGTGTHFLERPVKPARLRALCHYALTRR